MRVIVAAGGTGGHLFPAQALARELQNEVGAEVFFVAKGLASAKCFAREEFAFEEVASAYRLWSGGLQLARGVWQALRCVRRIRPDVCVGFGSYHSLPVLAACWLAGVPLVLHEANVVPGKVNRLFARVAAWTGLFFPQTKLAGSCRHVGLPLRSHLQERPSREESLQRYGLAAGPRTLLVFGGSQGAQCLNELLHNAAPLLAPFQVIHCTGGPTAQLEARYKEVGVRAAVIEFETQMQYAWAAADCFVGRAGALTIAEQLAFRVPGVYVPYARATDGHQTANARSMEAAGCGRVLLEQEVTPQRLVEAITTLPVATWPAAPPETFSQTLITYWRNRCTTT